jgi:UDP-N-acetylglucosamine--N-acetylmuramyl-(pentapeptide) pyrophosphoryl-undecaprenol N-acetylglucosamine transferase
VVIAAGGTAGHLVPALALADALRDRGAAVSFIGTGRGLETKLVPAAGYELDRADLRGLERRLSLKFVLFLWSLVKGSIDCLAILKRRRPAVVVGGGGYVSAMPVFWAALGRKRTMIVELDSHMGLANRFLAPLVDRIALSFPIDGREGPKYLAAGRPMSQALLQADASEGRRRFGLRDDSPVVLVMGGSLGARSINQASVEAFGQGRLPFQLVHISGRRDYESVKKQLEGQGYDHDNYHLLDYTDDLPVAEAAASLVVGRAGASVQELAALGKPALLVPYPHATADHQSSNARWMADAGAAEVIGDSSLDAATLAGAVNGLLKDEGKLRRMAEASSSLVTGGGAGIIADEIMKLVKDNGRK